MADATNCGSTWQYASVTTQKYWQVAATKITAGSTTVTSDSRQAILFSNTPFIYGPKADTDAIAAQANATAVDPWGFYSVPCNTSTDGLPSVTFTVGDMDLVLAGSDYLTDVGVGGRDW